jgi:hypothetical protein
MVTLAPEVDASAAADTPASEAVVVQEVTSSSEGSRVMLRARVDGQPLWFDLEGVAEPLRTAEPFVAAWIPMAMKQGRDIEVRGSTVSPAFLAALARVQEVVHAWNPRLRPVAVRAETAPVTGHTSGAAAFFSGGVDSWFTFLRREHELTALIFIASGFDLGDEGVDERIARMRTLAGTLGKTLVVARTNFRARSDAHDLKWGFSHGFVLAALGLAVGLERVFVPASYTYRHLAPWGSHPVLDELWRTESQGFEHDGAGHTRFEKLAALVGDGRLAAHFHVCWQEGTANCGHCSKCVRTRMALRLLGRSFGDLTPLTDLRDATIRTPHHGLQAAFLEDLLHHATLRKDAALATLLRRRLARYELQEAVILLDRALLGGRVRRWYLSRYATGWRTKTAAWGARD